MIRVSYVFRTNISTRDSVQFLPLFFLVLFIGMRFLSLMIEYLCVCLYVNIRFMECKMRIICIVSEYLSIILNETPAVIRSFSMGIF